MGERIQGRVLIGCVCVKDPELYQFGMVRGIRSVKPEEKIRKEKIVMEDTITVSMFSRGRQAPIGGT